MSKMYMYLYGGWPPEVVTVNVIESDAVKPPFFTPRFAPSVALDIVVLSGGDSGNRNVKIVPGGSGTNGLRFAYEPRCTHL